MRIAAKIATILAIIIILQASSKAEVVSYTMYITSGGANTSGGFGGGGCGYLTLSGRFKLIIDYDAGSVNLENINISFNNKPSYLDWNALNGTFDSGNINLSSPCNLCSTCDHYLSGTFDGSTAFLRAGMSQCAYDGFGYDCNFTAVVIPVSSSEGGKIVAWGQNYRGECNVPPPNIGFSSITAGHDHSLGLKADGSIVAWGANYSGQCDVPEPNTGFTAIAAGYGNSLGLKQDGSIVVWEYYNPVPLPNTDFRAIAAGWWHSLGLKADGSIVAWGLGSMGIHPNYGQCIVPEPNTGFKAIAAGAYHSLGLKEDGSIAAWGRNEFGECNIPSPNTDFIAIATSEAYSLGLKADGSIIAWGYNEYGQCNVPPPNKSFTAIATGGFRSLGLKQDGSIVAWGENRFGEYNVPFPNKDFIAIAAGNNHSLGLKSSIVISRCTVTGGKFPMFYNAFSISGDIALPQELDFNNVEQIDVNIISLSDGASVYRETVFSSVVKGKFKYAYKIPSNLERNGAISSLAVDSIKNTFSIKAKKIYLRGLGCPLRLELTLSGPVTGDHKLSGMASESIVNRRKSIPTCLMSRYKNTLIVTMARVTNCTSRQWSDSLSVKGEIAVKDFADSNLATQDVDIIWGDQLFTIPSGSLRAARTGHSYTCSKTPAKDKNGLITANINLDKCTFKIKINNAMIDDNSGIVPFVMGFVDFDETVNVNLD